MSRLPVGDNINHDNDIDDNAMYPFTIDDNDTNTSAAADQSYTSAQSESRLKTKRKRTSDDMNAKERKEKSLGSVCHKLVDYLNDEPVDTDTTCDDIATALGVERRRVWDALNVCESVNMVTYMGKGRYVWHSASQLHGALTILQRAVIDSNSGCKRVDLFGDTCRSSVGAFIPNGQRSNVQTHTMQTPTHQIRSDDQVDNGSGLVLPTKSSPSMPPSSSSPSTALPPNAFGMSPADRASFFYRSSLLGSSPDSVSTTRRVSSSSSSSPAYSSPPSSSPLSSIIPIVKQQPVMAPPSLCIVFDGAAAVGTARPSKCAPLFGHPNDLLGFPSSTSRSATASALASPASVCDDAAALAASVGTFFTPSFLADYQKANPYTRIPTPVYVVKRAPITASIDTRKEQSMIHTSQVFIQMFLTTETRIVTLDDAGRWMLGGPVARPGETELKAQANFKSRVRRLYDIANAFASLGLIEKIHLTQPRKPAFKWCSVVFPLVSNVPPNSYTVDVDNRHRIGHSRRRTETNSKDKEEEGDTNEQT